jgi:hypothetical protein
VLLRDVWSKLALSMFGIAVGLVLLFGILASAVSV